MNDLEDRGEKSYLIGEVVSGKGEVSYI